jgi:peptidoglycan-N-acetylglucosamine deacetylase
MKRACVSVDLDGLVHYARIHGLAETALDARTRGLHLSVALPRLLSLFEEEAVPATFFVVGEDAVGEGEAPLRAAFAKGHELSSHSHTHPYALGRADEATVATELARAEEALLGLTGKRPTGFRAPGYTLSVPMLQALLSRGYQYDASVFPAAPYYLAKAAVLLGMALSGRTSASALDSPSVLLAPRQPYRPDAQRPYAQGTSALLELPMTVTPVLRVPFFGTLLTLAPFWLVERCYQAVRKADFLSLELHALDVLDEEDGVPEALVKAQRDVRVPRAEKLRRLHLVLGWLRRDFQLCTLQEAARGLLSEIPAKA